MKNVTPNQPPRPFILQHTPMRIPWSETDTNQTRIAHFTRPVAEYAFISILLLAGAVVVTLIVCSGVKRG